jgi:hypothetical protein
LLAQLWAVYSIYLEDVWGTEMVSLSDLVKRPKSPLSLRQVELVKKWIAEDWQSNDMDREAVQLIQRLVLTIEKKNA